MKESGQKYHLARPVARTLRRWITSRMQALPGPRKSGGWSPAESLTVSLFFYELQQMPKCRGSHASMIKAR
jgi:hypothetical protein